MEVVPDQRVLKMTVVNVPVYCGDCKKNVLNLRDVKHGIVGLSLEDAANKLKETKCPECNGQDLWVNTKEKVYR